MHYFKRFPCCKNSSFSGDQLNIFFTQNALYAAAYSAKTAKNFKKIILRFCSGFYGDLWVSNENLKAFIFTIQPLSLTAYVAIACSTAAPLRSAVVRCESATARKTAVVLSRQSWRSIKNTPEKTRGKSMQQRIVNIRYAKHDRRH